jgi:hypothetical protein
MVRLRIEDAVAGYDEANLLLDVVGDQRAPDRW